MDKKALITITATLILIGLLSGCTNVQTGMIDRSLQPLAPNMIVVSHPVGAGFYAVVEKIDGHWQVVKPLRTTPITRRDHDGQEILFVNRGLRSVAPSFDPRINTGEATECTPYIQDNRIYGLCYSSFSKSDIGSSFFKNIASCALTFCFGYGTTEILDHEKVQEVVVESGLINIVKDTIDAEFRQEYLAAFSRTMRKKDVGSFEEFIEKYKNKDPDNLIPEVEERLNTAKASLKVISAFAELIHKANVLHN
jgi:hypothetical protein